MNRRKKMPRNRELRKKLMIQLWKDGWNRDRILLILGYALNRQTRHLMQEHPEVLSSEFWKLYKDDDYRKEVVERLLRKYGLDGKVISKW